jgi:hypothetical protein
LNEEVEGPFDFLVQYDEDGELVWPQLRFELMWTQHGGSGLGMTFEDCQNLDYADILELYGMLRKRRRDEAKAIEQATKR